MITTIFTRPNGDRIVFDEFVSGLPVAHVETAGGKRFAPRGLANILSRGYWEPVPGMVMKEWDEDKYVRDELGRFSSTGGLSTTESSIKLWKPALSELDKLNAKNGYKSDYAKDFQLSNPEVRSFMKEQVAKDVAGRLDNVATKDLVDVAWSVDGKVPDPDVAVALTPVDNFLFNGFDDDSGRDDYQLVSLDNNGDVRLTIASDVIEGSNYPDGYEKNDVISEIENINGSSPFQGWALQGTPEAEQMVRQAATSNLIQQWSFTSNDTSATALAMQDIAAQKFGIENHADWNVDTSGLTSEAVSTMNAYRETLVNEKAEVLGSFLQAQYDSTQDYLSSKNIDSLVLYRGMKDLETPVESGEQWVQTRPMTSWSTSEQSAAMFSDVDPTLGSDESLNSVMVKATVPADRILSLPMTGFGCLNEQEVVVLGGYDNANVVNGKDYVDRKDANSNPWS
jgi:hypothetical protein